MLRSLATDFPATYRKIMLRRPRLVLASSGIHREQKAVRSGIKQYQADQTKGYHRFLLRRNVHRLEKGLISWPRRSEFASDYIGVTVAAAVRVYGAEGDAHRDAEAQWVLAVLASYFEATREAESPAIRSAESDFLKTFGPEVSRQDLSDSGPHHHSIDVEKSGIDIEALRRLAVGRRSVRWFEDRQVDRAVIDRAVEIASESPTACNRAPYRFEFIDTHPGVQRIAECAMGTGGYAHQIPGIAVVIGDLSAFFHERDRHLIYIDSSLAAMAFVYGLEVQGVASCMINWPDIPERDARIRKHLNLANTERVIMLIAFGYADPERLVALSAKGNIDAIRSFSEV
ncbi:nitroreductase family protein [Mycobacterium sp. ITM-2016-00317]|uniref:nitroreductase family protein n=1 Tax=Mycobacterium sp. ITM-2016-00317 TaxID=2099694 RepID=UPI00287F6E27|nr:nitroreductase family protein [Mycobacterium sp. ITM-2016-00317]WNG88959.1 nitroreductase family protein [Mycobacterium sp. ITM-2016-00317]